MIKQIFLSSLLCVALFGEDVDELLSEFDDSPSTEVSQKKVEKKVVKKSEKESQEDELLSGFDDEDENLHENTKEKEEVKNYRGSFTQSLNYSYKDKAKPPHEGLSSFKSRLFLEYKKDLRDDFKLKVNGVAFYDWVYTLRDRDRYTTEEKHSLESEVELYDFYIDGKLSSNLDMRIGRQVVVWGRSDNIRITDVINPLDFRKPGMVDIEDLRLPLGIVKFDYYVGDWDISPMAIVEQRENKMPPFGSEFYPSTTKLPSQSMPHKTTYALKIGGEFSGYDIDFYFADLILPDEFGLPQYKREKSKMYGFAFNYIVGSWLFKGELAKKSDLRFFGLNDTYKRVDGLLGVEYNGIADTKISYDFAKRSFDKSSALFEKDIYQHAFRFSSDFVNATLHANYLLSLFGKNADDGGFQRAWIKYDIKDALSTNFGVVDYIGGSNKMDRFKNNDMIFADIVYSF